MRKIARYFANNSKFMQIVILIITIIAIAYDIELVDYLINLGRIVWFLLGLLILMVTSCFVGIMMIFVIQEIEFKNKENNK